MDMDNPFPLRLRADQPRWKFSNRSQATSLYYYASMPKMHYVGLFYPEIKLCLRSKTSFSSYSEDYFPTNLAFIYESMFTRQSLQNNTIACDLYSPCVSEHTSAKHGKTATMPEND